MRIIGHVSNESEANTFSEFLYGQRIDNQVEHERGSGWVVWVHSEDEVERARVFLQEYLRSPKDRKFANAASEAQKRRQEDEESTATSAKRTFDADKLFSRPVFLGMTILTAILVGICVAIWAAAQFPNLRLQLAHVLMISLNDIGNNRLERLTQGLIEIKSGQVWRLITPILFHVHPVHLFFNVFALRYLGTVIEIRKGSRYLLFLVLLSGVISNLGQYIISGPAFLGISGVVYGLLGYIWMKGKFDPSSGFFLDSTNVAIMLIWLVLGYTNATSKMNISIANGAHTVGLIVGMICGYGSALRQR